MKPRASGDRELRSQRGEHGNGGDCPAKISVASVKVRRCRGRGSGSGARARVGTIGQISNNDREHEPRECISEYLRADGEGQDEKDEKGMVATHCGELCLLRVLIFQPREQNC